MFENFLQPVSVKTGIKFLRTVSADGKGKDHLKGQYGDLVARKSTAAVAAEREEHGRELWNRTKSADPHNRAGKHHSIKAVADVALFVSHKEKKTGSGSDRPSTAADATSTSGGSGSSKHYVSSKNNNSENSRPQSTPTKSKHMTSRKIR